MKRTAPWKVVVLAAGLMVMSLSCTKSTWASHSIVINDPEASANKEAGITIVVAGDSTSSHSTNHLVVRIYAERWNAQTES